MPFTHTPGLLLMITCGVEMALKVTDEERATRRKGEGRAGGILQESSQTPGKLTRQHANHNQNYGEVHHIKKRLRIIK